MCPLLQDIYVLQIEFLFKHSYIIFMANLSIIIGRLMEAVKFSHKSGIILKEIQMLTDTYHPVQCQNDNVNYSF